MKKSVFALALVALGMTSAFAGEACTGKSECPCRDGPPPIARESHRLDPANFAELKTNILAHIKEHQACVEAAQSAEDLSKCRPKPNGGDGRVARPARDLDRSGPDRAAPPAR